MPSVVITGGSAGVGRATALAFAARQWNVALVGRSDSGLEDAKRQIQQITGDVLAIQADVADPAAMFQVADRVVERWGTIEVWVNNAMASVFAPLTDLSPDEFRRVTDVTYHGYVFGTMAALRHMRPRNAGTIVQVGSALSYRAIPLQSAYCGAKFAIRGFTDALRSELQHEQSAIRVTMVHLPAVNTPQFSWARNKLAFRPQPIPPVYQPETIGEAIFRASQTAPREVWVGMPSLKAIVGTIVAPGLLDRFLASKGYDGQLSSEPQSADQPDNLFTPGIGHKTHGRFDQGARTSAMRLNPAILRATTVALLILVVGAAVFALVQRVI
jgi:NAD(P)-dependent dehydrogenase (short-subunit alcohol dehydrogenase family)